ncbi:asparagine synthase (glutamine-hydrolyzing) [Thalassobaculum sp. OXR-137]|uniref:asparagine synthase (glutamine-hydrolyzing) n=1 Tax=Thalassobaculum sp. OXR-137 TaxID=3100173 RepID=UPI002AC965E4|nr:asparagine synthase (glutamine-hydrolyzing) [Thalassobaculum sp. OXR-137]WPZ32675.1 asparagine synthase (glutamine-hydrolyzing) [Thalassobaculum sp. OXR-137]
MCGFVGCYTPGRADAIDAALLDRMTRTLEHRGPDGRSLTRMPHLGLGFCRLAIVDLAGGNQPIHNEDRSIALVCNGEIYNHLDLRRSLQRRGHSFRAQVDVEVLVHLYEEHGPAFLDRLNGQFALALYDPARNRLLLARDPAGIAPLYYVWRDGTLLFASELKALLEHPLVGRRIDLTALDQVVTFPGPVSPRSLFADIRSLPPGHLLILEGGEPVVCPYWDLDYPLATDLDPAAEPDYEALESSLRASVGRRLQADVDVGFYLSGGLDSSLIAALIGEHDRAAGLTRKRHAFSIGFPDRQIDERCQQEMVARRIGAVHHTVLFDAEQIHARLRAAVRHAEAPLKESYNTCSLALSELVRRHGLKVVLTGEGADELFGGYVGYRLDARPRSGTEDFSLDAQLERDRRRRLWGDADFFYERDYVALSETKRALYAPDLAAELDRFECSLAPPVDTAKLVGRHPLHQRSYVDFKLRLADHLLADHGDRVAYAHSVEARYPFLDPEVIDWVRTAPPGCLVRGGIEKAPLRRLAADRLPPEIAGRQKFGFVAPSSAALLQARIPWVEDLLSRARIAGAGYFDPDTVERLKTRYRAPGFALNTTFEPDLLMIVLSFEILRDCFRVPPL